MNSQNILLRKTTCWLELRLLADWELFSDSEFFLPLFPLKFPNFLLFFSDPFSLLLLPFALPITLSV